MDDLVEEDRKSIGIQVGQETRRKETFTDTGLDELERIRQKNLTGIFDRLKNELEELHTHIERQQMKF